jgi:hypothetical protein
MKWEGIQFFKGCADGGIIIWDFMTRGIAQVLKGHTKPITCLRSDRKFNLIKIPQFNLLVGVTTVVK